MAEQFLFPRRRGNNYAVSIPAVYARQRHLPAHRRFYRGAIGQAHVRPGVKLPRFVNRVDAPPVRAVNLRTVIFRNRCRAVVSAALLVLCLYLTLTTGAGLFLLPGVLWLAVKGVLPNGAKPDKINCYKK